MEQYVSMPLLGEKFPHFEVKTTFGKKNLPEDYAGKWVILFSHPGDFTPVCTTEFIAFNQHLEEFRAMNTELIGLSVDQLQSHMKWTEFIGEKTGKEIGFPVIADELGKVAKALGMIHEAKGTNTVRAVFIIDPNGTLRLTMYYPQEVGRSINEIKRALNALQVADKNHVAAPENYPNNEFFGKDVVILPPPSDETAKKAREEMIKKGEVKALDWWLSYKVLK
ncbi:MAG: peroxiredoxin [Bacilli bacterium]|jgi:peroxiredoxin (alkyl hydroperoxide reductase subunit C)|nr:peroxiredoxin [Bacilli bacterium]MCH4210816.1 peroxiredoxin [Bacilli bacterium]MCH4228822.1 peroxiredoxin [Bacilli bacterium]MCH4277520.1 peroxiredoxin [Bacilli bacterium]